jgi:hypothetical protein
MNVKPSLINTVNWVSGTEECIVEVIVKRGLLAGTRIECEDVSNPTETETYKVQFIV